MATNSEHYAILTPFKSRAAGSQRRKISTPSEGYAVLHAIKHKLTLPSKSTLSGKVKRDEGPKKDRYLSMDGLVTEETDASSQNQTSQGQTKKKEKDRSRSRSRSKKDRRKSKTRKLPIVLGVLFVVVGVFAISIVLFFVLITQPSLVNLDANCRLTHGDCAYYRHKFVVDCSAKQDYCSSVQINADLHFVQIPLTSQERGVNSEFRANLTFHVAPKEQFPIEIPDGVPCFMPVTNDTVVGLCIQGTCKAPKNYEPVQTYTLKSPVDGKWTPFGWLNIKTSVCFQIPKKPEIKKQELTKSFIKESCKSSPNCQKYDIVYRHCSNPTPSFGGRLCSLKTHLLGGQKEDIILEPDDFPIRLKPCRECSAAGGGDLDNLTNQEDFCSPEKRPSAEICRLTLKTSEHNVNLNAINDKILWTSSGNDFTPCCQESKFGYCIAGTCIPFITSSEG